MAAEAHPCVIVLLRPQIALALAKDWPIKTFSLDGDAFKPVGPHWSGFYDWLRDVSGRVIGVRYHPSEDTDFLLKLAGRLKYAEAGKFGDLSLFFGDGRTIDPATSEDQCFLYDQVFETAAGEYAIAFAKPDLLADEQAEMTPEWQNAAIVYGQRDS